jgi:benzodiazapine receptor
VNADPQGAHGSTAPRLLPRLAALVLVLMAAVLWVDVLFRERLIDAIGSSGYSTTAGVVISAVVLPVAIGLWLRAVWAWWAGLVAGAWQLLSHLLYIVVATASGDTVGAVGWLIALLLVVFLVVLLLPATRAVCLGRQAGERPR